MTETGLPLRDASLTRNQTAAALLGLKVRLDQVVAWMEAPASPDAGTPSVEAVWLCLGLVHLHYRLDAWLSLLEAEADVAAPVASVPVQDLLR